MGSCVKYYLVGGSVRDELLGMKSKDLDYSCEAPSYAAMLDDIRRRGGEIFVENPEFLTVRAKVPQLGACDFVMCRKDGAYIDGRRPEEVIPGTLYDDLARRDFTVNAIAKDEDGNYIDPFGGQKDLKHRLLRCVGNPEDRFAEDYLRLLRAIRFSITKGLTLDGSVCVCLNNKRICGGLRSISVERIREELDKCFRHDTIKTLQVLDHFNLEEVVFDRGLRLFPTLKS